MPQTCLNEHGFAVYINKGSKNAFGRRKFMEEVKVLGTENGILTIALSGDIDLGNAESFYTETLAAYQAAPSDITFDCKELNFIDSTTLGTFVKILKMVKADGHTVRLTNLQTKIKKLFLICSLDKIMEIA